MTLIATARKHRCPVAVLVSGSGTNLQAIIDSAHGRDGVEVVAVVGSLPGLPALERARRAGIETAVFAASDHPSRRDRDIQMARWLAQRGVELVVLAGFMELLDHAFLERFPNRVINVHPALLPAFPGAHPIEDQIAYGVKTGGVTVHFVDDGVDSGPIILQEAVRLPPGGDEDDVLEALHEVEHQLLPKAVRLLARGGVRFDARNPRLVLVDEEVLTNA